MRENAASSQTTLNNHKEKFSTEQVALAFQSLKQLLDTNFTKYDEVNDQDIEVYDVNQFNSQSYQLIYDTEIQMIILKADQKLKRLYQCLRGPEVHAPKTVKHSDSASLQKIDFGKVLGPMKFSNTPNALFNQNF